jgi:hypothetical protein
MVKTEVVFFLIWEFDHLERGISTKLRKGIEGLWFVAARAWTSHLNGTVGLSLY